MASDLIDRATSHPASKRLVGAAGKYAQALAKKWATDLTDKIGGAPGGVAEKVGEAVSGVGKSKSNGAKKATVIIEDIDVGVPVSTAFNQWTQYQEFATFMKGVETIDPEDETSQNWRVKIGPSRRSFQGRVLEQVPDRRIRWTSRGKKGSSNGVITFHPLADDLTKILVVIEYYPSGPVEHVGNAFRVIGRRTRLDLKNFRKYVTLKGEGREGRQETRGEAGRDGGAQRRQQGSSGGQQRGGPRDQDEGNEEYESAGQRPAGRRQQSTGRR